MFRRIVIRRTLIKATKVIIAKYGKSKTYSRAQINIICTELGIVKDAKYVNAFLGDVSENADESDHFLRLKKSIYRYLNPNILDAEIENNDFCRAVYIEGLSEIRGDYTETKRNGNIATGGKLG
jgi:hypothetical protein